ncbi:hypothetical protein SISSUDRAFT_1119998 [Sistotremastrum suecicum HHB10207 ss-3]|uniref:F-box domain-containing protein n=1 Tax=Sistotremastrum suecicum HHB10207 ss-3 TaxID=1314776 RepID=A0A166CVT0_9AGAM|nr:hypothetical protein SISSUDRAFT_1119998 [Sistotremastrum suecicum HHB10207 ss-3]
MYIPPEVVGEIAQAIRGSSWESIRSKSQDEWHAENAALCALSLVSKPFMWEAIPVLWSEIFLEQKYDQSNLKKLFILLKKIVESLQTSKHGHRYASYVRLFSLDAGFSWVERLYPFDPTSNVTEILSRTSNLQFLRMSNAAGDVVWTSEISSLRFPSLRIFRLENSPNKKKALKLASQFFLGHPDLEELYLQVMPDHSYPWENLRASNPLPKLKIFTGALPELKLLPAHHNLESLSLIHGSSFLKHIVLIANPFSNVTSLSVLSGRFSLDEDILLSLSSSFPALQMLNGIGATNETVKFILLNDEDLTWCLPRLHTLIIHEVSNAGQSFLSKFYLTLTDDAIELTFSALRKIFPVITTAVHMRDDFTPGREILRETRCSITADGIHVERKVRPMYSGT